VLYFVGVDLSVLSPERLGGMVSFADSQSNWIDLVNSGEVCCEW
jgi:hypothetical protein